MLSTIVLVLSYSSIVIAQSSPPAIRFNEETLNKLRIPSDRQSILESYDEFELHNDYQCAVECLKDRHSCTGFTYDLGTNLCSLYNDPVNPLDEDAKGYASSVRYLPFHEH